MGSIWLFSSPGLALSPLARVLLAELVSAELLSAELLSGEDCEEGELSALSSVVVDPMD
jgi:hypothetical protein